MKGLRLQVAEFCGQSPFNVHTSHTTASELSNNNIARLLCISIIALSWPSDDYTFLKNLVFLPLSKTRMTIVEMGHWWAPPDFPLVKVLLATKVMSPHAINECALNYQGCECLWFLSILILIAQPNLSCLIALYFWEWEFLILKLEVTPLVL